MPYTKRLAGRMEGLSMKIVGKNSTTEYRVKELMGSCAVKFCISNLMLLASGIVLWCEIILSLLLCYCLGRNNFCQPFETWRLEPLVGQLMVSDIGGCLVTHRREYTSQVL
jgi:hypothetical protein